MMTKKVSSKVASLNIEFCLKKKTHPELKYYMPFVMKVGTKTKFRVSKLGRFYKKLAALLLPKLHSNNVGLCKLGRIINCSKILKILRKIETILTKKLTQTK